MTISSQGLSKREAGARSSSQELHNWTPYELRQELKNRGYFLDDYEGPINHEILLKKLTQLLHDETVEKERIRLESISKELDMNRQQGSSYSSVSQRFARKQEAIERSRLRQMNTDYFLAKKLANEQGLGRVESSSNQEFDKNASESGYNNDTDSFENKRISRIGGRCA